MILVNTDYIEGRKFEMIGLVKGSMIQSVHVGKDIVNSFKTLVGGELTSYTEMMNEARAIATRRMSEEAANDGRRCNRQYSLYIQPSCTKCS